MNHDYNGDRNREGDSDGNDDGNGDGGGQFELTRRRALGALGTVGIASAGAGLGTSAYFSDAETFEDNALAAGELDLHVAWEEHYSDWSADEADGLAGDVRMENASRPLDDGDRIGLPSNAAPTISVGSEADATQFLNNTVPPENGTYPVLDGTGYDANAPPAEPCSVLPDGTDASPVVIDLADVKPGDFGEVTFSFAPCDNPAFVWMQGAIQSAAENGTTEPEADDPDEAEGVVELLDAVQAAVWVDDGNNFQNGDEAPVLVGSLREVLTPSDAGLGSDPGLPLDGDLPASEGGGAGARNCFSASTVHHVVFAWWLPVDHANEIQTDSVTFDLGFYAEQCRHNSGTVCAGPATDLDTSTGEWQVTTVPDSLEFETPAPPREVEAVPPNWVEAPDGCSWVHPSEFAFDPGEYVYERTFTLSEGCPLDLRVSADNSVLVELDDGSTTTTLAQTTTNTTFEDLHTVSEQLPAGQYTLRVTVTNDGLQTGLLVCGGTCDCP